MGLLPDTALTNAAISACDKGGRWQKALELFERMEVFRLPRDAITYSATISALAKGKQWHAALQVFDHMQASGVEADVVACCSLINALERGGQWQLAEKLFLQMCTVQSNGQPLSPMFSANGKLMRSHSSPTSPLDVLTQPPELQQSLLGTIGEGSPLVCNRSRSALPSPRELEPLASSDILKTAALAAAVGSPVQPIPALQRQDSPCNGSGTAGSRLPEWQAAEELAVSLERGLSLGRGQEGREPALDTPTPGNRTPTASRIGGETAQDSGGAPSRSLLHPPLTLLSASLGEDGGAEAGGNGRKGTPAIFQPSSSPTEEGASPHVAAAHQLHRAMTVACCNDLDMCQEQRTPLAGEGVASMFNFSHAARVAPNRVCCNALLAAYARAKPPQWQKACHLLAAMWKGGPSLAPDTVSYNTLLKAFTNASQLAKAVQAYQEMVHRGVRPTVTTYNCLIAAASDAGAHSTLQEMGEWLDQEDTEVRSSCINGFVSGLVKVGRWEEAVSRFNAMLSPSSPVRPTASTFNTIMTGYMRLGRYDKVRDVFEDMVSSGLTPSIVTFNTLLSSYATLGAWEDAMHTMKTVIAAQLEGVAPNTATFNTILAAIAAGVPSEPPHRHAYLASCALQVYHQMQCGAGTAPDASTYTTLIKILSAAQHPQQVLAMHEVMMSQGLTPDAPTAATVLSAAAQQGQIQKAVGLAHSLAAQGVPVDPVLHSALLHTCLALGAWEQVVVLCSVAHTLQGSNPSTRSTFNAVLNAAVAAGQFGVVVELLLLMRAAGVEVDPDVARMVMDGSQPSTPSIPAPGITPFCAGTPLGQLPTPSPMLPQPPPPARATSPGLSPPPACHPPLLPSSQHGSSAGISGVQAAPPAMAFNPGVDAPPPPAPLQRPQSFSPGTPAANSELPSPGASFLAASPTSPRPLPPACQPPAGRAVPAVASLQEAHSMLGRHLEEGDAQGALDVLAGLKQAGLTPDKDMYTRVIRAMVRSQQPHMAVQLACEAHTLGALHHYALPDLGQGPPLPGTALGNVVDLRGCGVEEGAAVLLTWLSNVAQLQPLGLVVKDRAVKIITSGAGRIGGSRPGSCALDRADSETATSSASPSASSDGAAAGTGGVFHVPGCDQSKLGQALLCMLTTGCSPVPAFTGLLPLPLPESAVTQGGEGGGILEVQTHALYRALKQSL